MTNSSPRRSKIWGFIKLLLVLFVYVLSLGPVTALYVSSRLDGPMPRALALFYVPAKWVRDDTPAHKQLALHDEWWNRQLRKH